MIELLVGMMASGKSLYALSRAREGWIIINDDAIVESVHGGDYTLYDKELKPLYKSIENHILAAAILNGKNVVIDRGVNVSVKSRTRFISIANSFDVNIDAIVFHKLAYHVHAERRSTFDNTGPMRGLSSVHWYKVAKRHAEEWQDPSLQEGFYRIKYLPEKTI